MSLRSASFAKYSSSYFLVGKIVSGAGFTRWDGGRASKFLCSSESTLGTLQSSRLLRRSEEVWRIIDVVPSRWAKGNSYPSALGSLSSGIFGSFYSTLSHDRYFMLLSGLSVLAAILVLVFMKNLRRFGN